LTESQRRSLKNIDVAFSEFWDESKNRLYDITDEIGPRLIIPTHVGSLRALEKATEKWPRFKRMQKEVTLTREKLPERTTFLLIGDWVKVYGSSLEIPEWEEN
jgi:L-ascorbate metabolism protein UlaG (beta-lactamase superfamily)